jgi:integrase
VGTLHRFRRRSLAHVAESAVVQALAKVLDLRAIQLLLGHADLKTTQRLNVTDEELQEDDGGEARSDERTRGHCRRR